MAERTKLSFFCIVWGDNPDSSIERLNEFRTQTELSDWINLHGFQIHPNDVLAGQCFLELPDGRDSLIIRGTRKSIKRQVKIC
jgi:hypothetical protein